MWHTPSGERTLRGDEAALIRALIAFVRDELDVDDPEPWTYGVSLFDDLLLSQKFVLLAYVGGALLRDDFPSPPLNAVNEAVVGVLMKALEQALEFEIDAARHVPDADNTHWRALLLAAVVQLDGDDGDLPHMMSCDRDDWSILVEVLDSFILWDDDWETPEMVMDKDPETARHIKRHLSIADDYFVAIAPDPTDAEVEAARKALRALIHSPSN